MFDRAQIQEFKEVGGSSGRQELEYLMWLLYGCVHLVSQAFNMIDQNRDGFIDNEDLKDMLASLGQTLVHSRPFPSY